MLEEKKHTSVEHISVGLLPHTHYTEAVQLLYTPYCQQCTIPYRLLVTLPNKPGEYKGKGKTQHSQPKDSYRPWPHNYIKTHTSRVLHPIHTVHMKANCAPCWSTHQTPSSVPYTQTMISLQTLLLLNRQSTETETRGRKRAGEGWTHLQKGLLWPWIKNFSKIHTLGLLPRHVQEQHNVDTTQICSTVIHATGDIITETMTG